MREVTVSTSPHVPGQYAVTLTMPDGREVLVDYPRGLAYAMAVIRAAETAAYTAEVLQFMASTGLDREAAVMAVTRMVRRMPQAEDVSIGEHLSVRFEPGLSGDGVPVVSGDGVPVVGFVLSGKHAGLIEAHAARLHGVAVLRALVCAENDTALAATLFDSGAGYAQVAHAVSRVGTAWMDTGQVR